MWKSWTHSSKVSVGNQSGKPQGAVTTAGANQSYQPWMKKGVIRGPNGGPIEVSILQDTGASQSLLL